MATWALVCLAAPVVLPIVMPIAKGVLGLGLALVGL